MWVSDHGRCLFFPCFPAGDTKLASPSAPSVVHCHYFEQSDLGWEHPEPELKQNFFLYKRIVSGLLLQRESGTIYMYVDIYCFVFQDSISPCSPG